MFLWYDRSMDLGENLERRKHMAKDWWLGWAHTTKIKHLLTDSEDWESVQRDMNAIADVLEADSFWILFRPLRKFRNIPKGDGVFGPCDYANKLLDQMYDFADEHRIWIG